jgi:cutinase-like protein
MKVIKLSKLGAVLVISWAALLSAPLPSASADPCPDVKVVFARGTWEAPGVGPVGQAFVDSLRSQIGTRSLDVYAVNYAASGDFDNRIEFARSVIDGIRDAGTQVVHTAADCPNTRIVLGGFSQGAAVAGYVTAAEIPPGVPAAAVPQPMAPEVANHVAAVVLMGKPSDQFMQTNGAPLIVIGPLYVPKTIDVCDPGDNVCNGATGGWMNPAHALYTVNGLANQAATSAAGRL